MVTYQKPFKNSCGSIYKDLSDIINGDSYPIQYKGEDIRIADDIENVRAVHIYDNYIAVEVDIPTKLKTPYVSELYIFERYEDEEDKPTLFEPGCQVVFLLIHFSIGINSNRAVYFGENTFIDGKHFDGIFEIIKSFK